MRFTLSPLRVIQKMLVAIALFIPAENVFPQNSNIWLDGFLYKNLGKTLLYEGNVGYKKQIEQDGWSDILLCNTVSWQALRWFTLDGGVEFHNAWDPTDPNMIELRPWIGQRFTIVQFLNAIHLEKPYFYARWDQRFLWYPEDGTYSSKNRMRFSLGGKFLLNSKEIVAKTIYIPFYFEYFYNYSGDAYEKYASHNRAVLGLGYAFSSKWRSEFLYYAQRSRNTYEEEFVKSDMVFQLQLKYFIE